MKSSYAWKGTVMSIESKYYIHESDRAALESLKAIPGFTRLLKSFMKEWNERQARLRNMSSFIRISENQLPKYYAMLDPICEKLGIEKPELYLMQDVRPNAFTSGETNPFIVITSGLLEALPEELIPTVLAHECGHIACHHVLYRTMGTIIFGGAAGTLRTVPFGAMITLPLQVAFFYWMRCSEYSADRAAVICDGNADKISEVCMRLAGFSQTIGEELNKEAFMEQAREYRKITSDSKWDKTLEYYLLSGASHPFAAVRALEATEWAASEQYQSILDGTYLTKETAQETQNLEDDLLNIPGYQRYHQKHEAEIVCPSCGTSNKAGALFCRQCGTKLEIPELKCPECGTLLEGDETFCPSCGHKLK